MLIFGLYVGSAFFFINSITSKGIASNAFSCVSAVNMDESGNITLEIEDDPRYYLDDVNTVQSNPSYTRDNCTVSNFVSMCTTIILNIF